MLIQNSLGYNQTIYVFWLNSGQKLTLYLFTFGTFRKKNFSLKVTLNSFLEKFCYFLWCLILPKAKRDYCLIFNQSGLVEKPNYIHIYIFFSLKVNFEWNWLSFFVMLYFAKMHSIFTSKLIDKPNHSHILSEKGDFSIKNYI